MKTLSRCRSFGTLIFGAIVASLIVAGPVRAEVDPIKELKREVLSDCEAAQKRFSSLSLEQQRDLLPYLRRVLDLTVPKASVAIGVGDLNSHLASGPRPDNPIVENPAINSDRELEAKRCTLTLIRPLGAAAFTAIPEIIGVITRATTPMTLRTESKALALQITADYQKAGLPFTEMDREVVDELIGLLDGEYAYIAEHLLVELQGIALSELIEQIPVANEREYQGIREVLDTIHHAGLSVAPLLYPLLGISEENGRLRALKLLEHMMPAPSEALPPVIQLLDDISTTTHSEARRVLSQLVLQSHKDMFSLESTIQDQLITNYRIAPQAERFELRSAMTSLLTRVEGLRSRFLNLAQGASKDLRTEILEVLTLGGNVAEHDAGVIFDAFESQDTDVREVAIRALSALKAKPSLVNPLLKKAIARLPNPKDLSDRLIMTEAILFSAGALGPHADPIVARFVRESLQYAFSQPNQALSDNFPRSRDDQELDSIHQHHPGVLALQRIGEQNRVALEQIARPGDSDKARRALAALGGIPMKPSSLSVAARLLSATHSGTVHEAARTLLRWGPPITAELSKRVPELPKSAAEHVAEVFFILGERTLHHSRVLFKSISTSTCETAAFRVQLIKDFTEPERRIVNKRIISCLGQNHDLDRDLLGALKLTTPLSEQEQQALLAIVASSEESAQKKLLLFDSAPDLGLPSRPIFDELIKLIQNSKGVLQIRAIKSFGRWGTGDPAIIELLLKLVSDEKNDRALTLTIVTTLAKTPGSQFDFKEWLEDTLNHTDHHHLSKSIRSFPKELAETLLLTLSGDDNTRLQAGSLRLLSEVMAPREQLPDQLTKLMSNTDFKVQLEAFRAAISCCPVQSDTIETFRRLIYSPMREKLFELNYSTSAQTALAQLQVTSPYFAERAFTIAILDTIKANAARPTIMVE